jgi:hypothetical protein
MPSTRRRDWLRRRSNTARTSRKRTLPPPNVAIWRHDLALARAETDIALALNPN